VVGEARIRAKLGRGGGAFFLLFNNVDASCSTLVTLALVGATAAESEAAEGMTRWRVGASPRALQNSRTWTGSPDALIRPEVKTTPDRRSANTGSDLSAVEVLREDCDVRVSGLGVPVPVRFSPRVMGGCNVVRGDSDALCT
jgi:hypothetical protein